MINKSDFGESISLGISLIVGLLSGFVIIFGIFYFSKSTVFAIIVGFALGAEAWFLKGNFGNQTETIKLRFILCYNSGETKLKDILDNSAHLGSALHDEVKAYFCETDLNIKQKKLREIDKQLKKTGQFKMPNKN